MPKIRRWHPLSHNLNDDPEVWELTTRFGDRALRVWLELLSIADRNDGLISGQSDYLATAIGGKCHMTQRHVKQVLSWCESIGWLISDGSLKIRNYAKYHRTRGANENPDGGNLVPYLPNLTLNLTKPEKEEEEKEIKTAHIFFSNNKEWPEEDRWLSSYLTTQNVLPQLLRVDPQESHILDHGWWEQVGAAIGGINSDWIAHEFARMGAYLTENPAKTPASTGWRTFIRNWLSRANEYEKRKNGNPTAVK